jgi:hypothetical protein
MTTEELKYYNLGKMVFGMITDALATPRGDVALASRTVTTKKPDGGKYEFTLFVARGTEVVKIIDDAIAKEMEVIRAPVVTETPQ